MNTQKREVILRRILLELEILLSNRAGVTIKELTRLVSERDPDLSCDTRTIRRDCLTFENLGLTEPRNEEAERRGHAWRVKASARLYDLFRC